MAIDRSKITKLAENYMAAGKVDRAIDEFLKLIEDRPDDFQLLNRVGDAYLQAGKIPDAIEMFKRSGMGFERGGFNSKATAVFKKAHRIVPEDLDVSERLAELYRQMNMIKDAMQIHIEVADLFTKKGLIKRALEEFAKVVDLDPKNLKNKVKLADLYNKEGMKDRAANIYLEVAEALALEQMHSEANQILERAKTMVSTPQVYLTQSRLCVIQKELASAADHLREGLIANPRSPELLDALAEVEIQSKCPDRALEALAQVPQLPEKSLLLCERALRDLVRQGQTDEALRLFKQIGREFARRGLGEAAARCLRAGLQGALTVEAWVQLAEIAHQSGNRAEQVECLRHAYSQANEQNDGTLAGTFSKQLQGLGVAPDQLAAPFATPSPALPARTPGVAGASVPEHTEMDPVRRMQIEQLERDAENSLRNRFMDRALDAFNKILELDPANLPTIERIADIHRATGVLTKVQMHYVKTAEKVAGLGFKPLAVELLDRAESMFPGSTRLYRRNLGLMDVPPPAPAMPPPFVPAAVIPMPAPPEALPVIELDDAPRGPWEPAAAWAPVPPKPEDLFQLPVDHLEELPPAPEPEVAFLPPPLALPIQEEAFNIPSWESLPESPAAPAEQLEEYAWSEITGDVAFPPLELEPLPFATVPPSPAPVDDELASTLSDIDFQLDYGSPEEAKLEIEAALKNNPHHPELRKRLDQAEEALRRLGLLQAPQAAQDGAFAHSFFDLTDVLGDALLESGDGEEMHDATNVVEKIQSVDELFNAFREGVEQQVKGDDYDTHYNLGIAYKEMLLLEPAIEEFKKAMVDPERTLECCSMLSICEQAQGNLDRAIQWLNQGIEAPGFPPEDAIGLRYDLGGILQLEGRPAEAQAQYQMVYDTDPDYREVAQLLA
jgi:tetratricopeptide (TPR) repeat protein